MRYNIKTGVRKIKTRTQKILIGAMALAFPAVLAISGGAASAAVSNNYSLFGDAQIVTPGNGSAHAAQARSDGSIPPNYGGVDYADIVGTTLSNLNTLSTDYQMTQGSCGGGAPRFSVGVTNGTNSGNIFIYLGAPPNYTVCSNTWANTGNLASPTNLVDTGQLPGGTFYDPYASAQTKYGSYTITDIALVVDAFWAGGTQAVQVDNTQINSFTYTYEPPPTKEDCKNGGWKNFTGSPGPFKNQGDCVSYFATKGKNPANG